MSDDTGSVRITNGMIYSQLTNVAALVTTLSERLSGHVQSADRQVTELAERVGVLETKVEVLQVANGKQEDMPGKIDKLADQVDKVQSSVDRTSWVPTILIPIITAAASALIIWAMHGFQ
jgi:peptidoglycan hydrolase CwlO-like protein